MPFDPLSTLMTKTSQKNHDFQANCSMTFSKKCVKLGLSHLTWQLALMIKWHHLARAVAKMIQNGQNMTFIWFSTKVCHNFRKICVELWLGHLGWKLALIPKTAPLGLQSGQNAQKWSKSVKNYQKGHLDVSQMDVKIRKISFEYTKSDLT